MNSATAVRPDSASPIRSPLRFLNGRPSEGRSAFRSVAYTVAALAGAGLLTASGVIHLNLWDDVYRDIPSVGPLFLIQGIVAILFGLAMLWFRRPIMAVAGAGLNALSIGGLLIATGPGLFGFQETLAAPFVQVVLDLEFAGLGLFVAALLFLAIPIRTSVKAQASAGQEPVFENQAPNVAPPVVASVADQTLEQPAAVAATVPDPVQAGPERIKWMPGRSSGASASAPVAQVEQPTSWISDDDAGLEQAEPSTEEQPAVPTADDATAEFPVAGERAEESSTTPAPAIIARPAVVTGADGPINAFVVAARQEEAVLADREAAFGPDHPFTLTSRTNLAYYYRSAGMTKEAVDVQEKVLSDTVAALGPDHPKSITARNNLDGLRRQARKTKAA